MQPAFKDTAESQSPSVGSDEQTDIINVPPRPRKVFS